MMSDHLQTALLEHGLQFYNSQTAQLFAKLLERTPFDITLKSVALLASPASTPGKRVEWTAHEDSILIEGVKRKLSWVQIAANLPPRTAKQCRNRYVN